MEYPFENLIFEGGGVKGIAYVGAFRELLDRGIIQNIKRVGGTSAGAINAVLLALGYTLRRKSGTSRWNWTSITSWTTPGA